jgi:pimeloyl-ACP methyl ester carboxylesterase
MRTFIFITTTLLAAAAVACSSGDSPERGALVGGGDDRPQFEWGNCKFDVPADARVDCGYLTVPENRSQPDGRKIRLHVGIFRTSATDKAADPIIYLGGGPGENSTEASSYFYDSYIEPFLKNRDFIVLDQRGTGYSEPHLDCPEEREMYRETLDEQLTREESRAKDTDAIKRCHDRLAAEGINLASYRSAESAADINDLRLALGYAGWNIYGVSYGTRLALTVMRDFPQGVRSVVLDSSYPLQANLYAAIEPDARRAFDVFFNGCASDPTCNASYPNLRGVFFQTVDELNRNPVTESLISPFTGYHYESVVVDGDGLLGFLFQALYSTDYIPVLPRVIYEVANGDTSLMAQIMGGILVQFEELFSPGMHVSVQCSDEVAFTNSDEVAAAMAPYPELAGLTEGDAFSGLGIFPVCQAWGAAPPDPKENAPVVSDVPTLIMSGEYDPITPPQWGQQVADTLSHHFLYFFPGVGHGVATANDCTQAILHAFVNDPGTEPDTSCIAGMSGPDWAGY